MRTKVRTGVPKHGIGIVSYPHSGTFIAEARVTETSTAERPTADHRSGCNTYSNIE